MGSFKSKLIIPILFFLGANLAVAQSILKPQAAPIPSYTLPYSNFSGGEGITITVNLWGGVKMPGRYEVPSSTDLVQLISLAGGPVEGAVLDKVYIVRKILQPDSSFKTEVIHVNLKKFQKTGEDTPLLSPGDTIIVPESTSRSLRLVLAFLGPLFSLLTAIGTLILVLRR